MIHFEIIPFSTNLTEILNTMPRNNFIDIKVSPIHGKFSKKSSIYVIRVTEREEKEGELKKYLKK